MPPAMRLEQSAAIPLIAVAGHATRPELPQKIPALLDMVWQFIRASSVAHNGLSLVLYHYDPADPERFPIHAGVCVIAPFTPVPPIVSIATPAGRVLATTAIGPYQQAIPEAHDALHAYARQHHLPLQGTSWELYGHWNSDESKLQTDIYYLLKHAP